MTISVDVVNEDPAVLLCYCHLACQNEFCFRGKHPQGHLAPGHVHINDLRAALGLQDARSSSLREPLTTEDK